MNYPNLTKILDVVDGELDIWKNTDNFDISIPIRKIFSFMPELEYTFFSYTKDKSQTNGFFTGKDFEFKIEGNNFSIKI